VASMERADKVRGSRCGAGELALLDSLALSSVFTAILAYKGP
jgi:hypothetical protein